GTAVEMPRTLGQHHPMCPALPKGFERCQTLHSVEKIRPQGAIRVTTLQAASGCPARKEKRYDEREQRKGHKHPCGGDIKPGHANKNQQRCQSCNNELRKI